ncbi:MAG: threonine dehydratase [Methylobacteriaceae bacterium]|nr:threonine dehydratase [Methylobacteriaceae bacterium]
MFSLGDLEHAHRQVQTAFAPTAQYRWPLLCDRVGTEVWVKHENHTPIGSFKVRGGLVYVGRLAREATAPNGVISATRGNHGQSLAYAGRRLGVPVTIVVPNGNSTEKNAAMRALGARLIEHGADFDEARLEAARLAEAEGLLFTPTFHPDLVCGVATWALELFRATSDLDALYVPIGLGSSICGAIRVRDLLGARTEIVGVQSAEAAVYAQSLEAGHAVELESADTNADGLAVRICDPDALTMIKRGVSRIVTVSDEEVANAIRIYWTDTHNLAEGAGAAALAALMQERVTVAGRRVGVLLSGGNIDLALFREWVLG